MSLSVIADGRGGFRLDRDGQQIGWVEGRAIGFRGFESAKDARQAASVAYGALRDWLARQRRMDPVPRSRKTVPNNRREDGMTWPTLGGVPDGGIGEAAEREPPWDGG